ncbi:hypothetical protein FQA39_LY19014 [Lamprigera yunnana]|nr:hypothetical protein FQA39_LY19014 [Lamprigera yunnana]
MDKILQLHVDRLLKDELILEINNKGGQVDSELNVKDLGSNAYIERVNEMCDAKSVNNQQLFKCAIELFERKALIWFSNSITLDWDSLCSQLRDEFLSRNSNEKGWNQIKYSTQGEKESICIFVAYINHLFLRLSVKVEDNIKLKIIRNNILPYYQNQLFLIEILSQDHLIELQRRIDEVKYNSSTRKYDRSNDREINAKRCKYPIKNRNRDNSVDRYQSREQNKFNNETSDKRPQVIGSG